MPAAAAAAAAAGVAAGRQTSTAIGLAGWVSGLK